MRSFNFHAPLRTFCWNTECTELAGKKHTQVSRDQKATITDLVRFAEDFKLKTPIPNHLVALLTKDPKKQEAIMQNLQQDNEEEPKTSLPSNASVDTAA